MTKICPNPACSSSHMSKTGTYRRKSDGQVIQRYRCRCCNASTSDATGTPCFAQNKRFLNPQVLALLASGITQNRLARLLHTTRVTIARKLCFLASQCAGDNSKLNLTTRPASDVQFDELETYEHTKCKPLSVALAVENGTRRILGFCVSQMPANGHLAKVSRNKYGPREDHRAKGLRDLFRRIRPLCADRLSLLSDKCPRYGGIVAKILCGELGCEVKYSQVKGARGRSDGLGELKRLRFDPLFSLNHTCAMLRANINRLFRKTWNTTKKAERLAMHLEIYAYFHNSELIVA